MPSPYKVSELVLKVFDLPQANFHVRPNNGAAARAAITGVLWLLDGHQIHVQVLHRKLDAVTLQGAWACCVFAHTSSGAPELSLSNYTP